MLYGIVYTATNKINSKKYVGITTQGIEPKKMLRHRKLQHIYDATNNRKGVVFHKALNKYGFDNFEWSVVDVAESEEELKYKETFWIRKLSTFIDYHKRCGYNMTEGGEINNSARGELNTNNSIRINMVKQIKLLLKLTCLDAPQIAKITDSTADIVKQIKEYRTWSWLELSEEDKLNDIYIKFLKEYPKDKKTFYVLDKKTLKIISEWKIQKECAKYYNINYKDLSACLLKKSTSVKNYMFCLKSNFNDEWKEEMLTRIYGKGFEVYSINGEYIGTWRNQSQCGRELGLSSSNISGCLKGKYKQAKGYVFKLINCLKVSIL